MSKKTPWEYGKSPAPRDWKEASEVLRQKPKLKKSTLMDRLAKIEETLKKGKP